ncbi:MAG: hypothetical protein EXR05_09595 [Acetobacteraceae bacterium]|nr:hypothetical protein [Acetobacteraceae bacterium]MSP29070.1 hypothetical protein [Acetobacteraceae bacterium]
MRGAPCHLQAQGKIERWHQTLKNRILLENYFLPGDLEAQIEADIGQTRFLRLEQCDRRTIQAIWHLAEVRRMHPDLRLACVYTGTTFALLRLLPTAITASEFCVETTGDSLRENACCR